MLVYKAKAAHPLKRCPAFFTHYLMPSESPDVSCLSEPHADALGSAYGLLSHGLRDLKCFELVFFRRSFAASDAKCRQAEAGKYFSIVVWRGLAVKSETTHINSAEIITIGTTGMKPKIAVPPGVRAKTSVPPTAHMTMFGF